MIVHADQAEAVICPIMSGAKATYLHCMGPRCMMWRKAGLHSNLGYCGLGGVPVYGWEDNPPTQLKATPPENPYPNDVITVADK